MCPKNIITFPRTGPKGADIVGSLTYTNPAHFFSSAFLTCQQGIISQTLENLTQNPIEWNASKNVMCDFKEVCQETLLLIDVGVWAVQKGWTPVWGPGFPFLDSVPRISCLMPPFLSSKSYVLFLHLGFPF